LLQNQPDDTGQFFYLTKDSKEDHYDLRPNIEADPQMKEDKKSKDKSQLLGNDQIRKDP
jgi:hypothetical protein